MLDFSLPIAVVFPLYFAALIMVGVWVTRRNQSLGDYVLGGRDLTGPQAGLSAGASDMSGWLLIGFPGAVYATGVGATWIAVGLAVGTYLNWRFVAPRLRAYSERAGSVSLPGYLEERFEDRTRVLRIISAAVTLIFFTVYVSSGLVASGVLFGTILGVDSNVAATAVMVVIVVYTAFGGFRAVSRTHVLQASLMGFALVALPLGGLVVIGGFGGLGEDLARESGALLNPVTGAAFVEGTWSVGESIGFVAIVSGLAWGLGYPGQPHILARFMGIRSVADVAEARRIGTGWVVVVLLGATLVGLLGVSVLDAPLENPETVFIVVTEQLTSPWVSAILLTAILAAIISTADSQLLVSATTLTEDFYRAFLNRRAGDRMLVGVGRGMVVVVAVVAYALALGGGSVLQIVAYAWAGFGAAFGPVVILSLFWRGMTWAGALAGIVTGALVVLVWPLVDPLETGIYEIVPGCVAATFAAVVCGRMGRRPRRRWAGPTGQDDGGDPLTTTAERVIPKLFRTGGRSAR
ncbi:sodium/proline symporter [Stackebrandtia albiflava]|uniref:Sodium/proline symporter n=1 Tax=Stackebrandtia albiflava TaxID=406432 RepID=A0A562V4N1_9ACTN|nr:sodium/proline symporter PutP [Stackebrandtia albiflava]TWJ12778.1 sodium/proline symporter [Stackebrandtia albiflava]